MPLLAQVGQQRLVLRRRDAVPDALGAERVSASQIDSGPVDSPACGTLCRPAARAAAKCGGELLRAARPTSGPPRPKLTRPSGRSAARRRG